MKELKYILFACICTLFASCMGDNYAEPEIDDIPYGNNELTETNVVTIEQLKTLYAKQIKNSTMTEVTEDIQIKGVVTGNDAGGNIYRMVPIDDGTGAINVSVDMGGLCKEMKVGQEVLISLKGLLIGGNRQQPQVGGIYTNTTPSSPNYGKQSIGSMNRYQWETHHKLIGIPDPSRVVAEEFDQSRISDESYLAANCGKLMTIKGVTLKDADGVAVYAPEALKDNANSVDRQISGISTRVMALRTSTYSNFANQLLPEGKVDITGIFNRYGNVWQIIARDADDIQPSAPDPTAIYEESFGEGQGAFTVIDKTPLPEGLTYVWAWDARYGMKASAYVNSTYYSVDSWLISPSIDLSSVGNATLKFDQALRYGSDNDVHVLFSTTYNDGEDIDINKWTELTLDAWPTRADWTFITSSALLKEAAGQANIHIAFRYTSNESAAATWEFKNFSVE